MPYKLTAALLTLFLVIGNFTIDRWERRLYHGDSCFYYLHVVSFWVNGDVGDYDKTITTLREVNPSSADPRDDIYGVRLTEKGRRYIKYTIGVPILETPFFALAHFYAKASPEYEANGWTAPYRYAVGLSISFYVGIGLYMLMWVLAGHFPRRTVIWTAVALVVATNLFYQATYVTMSHGFLFFLHAWLLYATVRFWRRPGVGRAALLGAIVGLIALTRVPEVVAAAVPLLWGIDGWGAAKKRVGWLLKNLPLLLPAGAAFALVFAPQIWYWYYVSGEFIFNPYQGEGFDFLRPRFFKAFFYFDNGWLIYTPIMALALVGLFFLRRYAGGVLIPILTFLVLHCWIHYSYYVYNYFPGLGQRPMVDAYPYLALGMAATFAVCFRARKWRWLPVASVLIFGALNLFQTWQSREGYIWSESHNAAFYVESFGKLSHSLNGLRAYHTGMLQPDEASLSVLDTLFVNDFSAADHPPEHQDTTYVRSGHKAYRNPPEFGNLAKRIDLPETGDYLEISTWAFLPPDAPYPSRDGAARLVIEVYNAEDRKKFTRSVPMATFIGNPTGMFWLAGERGKWGKANFYLSANGLPAGGWAKAYVHNPSGQAITIDDFTLITHKKK